MAGGFTETAFIAKLTDLNGSSQSIQTLSLWLIHHRKHYSTVVKIWMRELAKAKGSKKLTLMYLANDVIQNSRKKGPEYGKEYGKALPRAFEALSDCDGKTRNSLERMLTIWKDRGIYDAEQIDEFKKPFVETKDQPPAKKVRAEEQTKRDKKKDINVPIDVDAKMDNHLSPHVPAGDPPEPEELIKAIQELELNMASADEHVRERIAQLPREVSEVSLISKIEDKEEAQKLAVQVKDAVLLLSKYNARLTTEMDHRRKVAVMIKDYLHGQEEMLTQAEKALEEYQDTLVKVYKVRNELTNHIQNLPDLTQLPNVVDGLAPLPSAEHLFMQ